MEDCYEFGHWLERALVGSSDHQATLCLTERECDMIELALWLARSVCKELSDVSDSIQGKIAAASLDEGSSVYEAA